ncbi:MAG: TIGR02186 family protein [Proteobacteria bacterium]|nr:TIGR02186 family protein [Pseudomonadota bacterium]
MKALLLVGLAWLCALAAEAMAQVPTEPPVAPRGAPTGGLLPAPPLAGQGVPAEPSARPDESGRPTLIMDLSSAGVSITSAFQGESLLVFGMFDPPGEIVVVVEGPPGRETVMRKERVLGLWLTTGRQVFEDVPSYYYLAASQPLQRLLAGRAGGEILSLEDRLSIIRPARLAPPPRLAEFRGGLVEVKRQEGLYPANIGQVTIQGGRLFRADLPFPSRLPEGIYSVRAYLLREGRIAATVSRPLAVAKVGFNAELASWSRQDGAFYGLGAIAMALLVGWFGGAVMRRL